MKNRHRDNVLVLALCIFLVFSLIAYAHFSLTLPIGKKEWTWEFVASLLQTWCSMAAVGIGIIALYIGYIIYKNQFDVTILQMRINRRHQLIDELYKEQDNKIKEISAKKGKDISTINSLHIGNNRRIISERDKLKNDYEALGRVYDSF